MFRRDEARDQQFLTQPGALASIGLCLAEELGELGVMGPVGVLDKVLQPQGIILRQASTNQMRSWSLSLPLLPFIYSPPIG